MILENLPGERVQFNFPLDAVAILQLWMAVIPVSVEASRAV
jgi:hypothetical protein